MKKCHLEKQTHKNYSTIKKKKILPFGTIWIDLEGTMLSEIIVQRKINTL